MKNRFVRLDETVVVKKIKVEDGIRTRRIDAARSPYPLTDISVDKITSPRANSPEASLDEFESHHYYTRLQERRSRRHRAR